MYDIAPAPGQTKDDLKKKQNDAIKSGALGAALGVTITDMASSEKGQTVATSIIAGGQVQDSVTAERR